MALPLRDQLMMTTTAFAPDAVVSTMLFPDSVGSAPNSTTRLDGSSSSIISDSSSGQVRDRLMATVELKQQAIRVPRLFLTTKSNKDEIMKSTQKKTGSSSTGVYYDNMEVVPPPPQEEEDDSDEDSEDEEEADANPVVDQVTSTAAVMNDASATSQAGASMSGSNKRKDSMEATDLDFLIATVPTSERMLDTKKKKKQAQDDSAEDEVQFPMATIGETGAGAISTSSSTTTKPADTTEEDLTSALCKAVDDWKPFTNHVANVMQREKLPFEYFDIWVPEDKLLVSSSDASLQIPTKNDDTSEDDTDDPSTTSRRVLRHVGHGTNGNTEMMSIMTMYNMNQFGRCSEHYAFLPGIGLPGRVFDSTEPMWDDGLQCATYTDFPRTDLAKKHGVRKGLGIPLNLTHHDGEAILVLYTTNDIPKDLGLVQMAYYEFQKHRIQTPIQIKLKQGVYLQQPVTQVGIAATSAVAATAAPRLALCNGTTTTNEEGGDTTSSVGDRAAKEGTIDHGEGKTAQDNDTQRFDGILPDDLDVELARFLGEHLPEGTGQSLQFVLFRAPCRRALYENVNIERLKQKYTILKSQQQLPHADIATLIVQEWELFCPNHNQLLVTQPW